MVAFQSSFMMISLPCLSWIFGALTRRQRKCSTATAGYDSSGCQGRLDRLRRAKGPEDFHRRDCRQRELGRDVFIDSRESQDAEFDAYDRRREAPLGRVGCSAGCRA